MVDYVVPLAIRPAVNYVQHGNGIPPEDKTPNAGGNNKNLEKSQRDDPVLGELWEWKLEGQPTKEDTYLEGPALKKYWLCWDHIIDQDGILCYQ